MASTLAMGGTLRHLRDLFGDGTAVGLGDGQLLARYADSRDEAAFEALVARHGPMVLATCRAVLKHEHDVEDAFQATFLVLASKARSVRAGDALGGWLHRVAYRAAVQAASSRGAGAAARRRPRRWPLSMQLHTEPDRRHRLHRARGARPPARSPAAAGGPLRPGGPDLRAGRRPTCAGPSRRCGTGWQGPAAAAGPPDPARRHRRGRRRRSWRGSSGRGQGGGPRGAGSLGGRRGDGRERPRRRPPP